MSHEFHFFVLFSSEQSHKASAALQTNCHVVAQLWHFVDKNSNAWTKTGSVLLQMQTLPIQPLPGQTDGVSRLPVYSKKES